MPRALEIPPRTHLTARMRKYRTPVMVMPMRTYRALWIMALSTFRPLIRPPGPELFVAACVLFAAVLLCAVVPLAAAVVTSSSARTENQQSRSRSRTNTRDEAIPTARKLLSQNRVPTNSTFVD